MGEGAEARRESRTPGFRWMNPPGRAVVAAASRPGRPGVADRRIRPRRVACGDNGVPPTTAPALSPQRLLPLIIATALFIENMDSTAISTSLPQIAVKLVVEPVALTIYLLALAVFIPVSDWVPNRFGTRRTLPRRDRSPAMRQRQMISSDMPNLAVPMREISIIKQ